jgi:hypothetical protein
MADQQRPVRRDSQDEAVPMIQRVRLDHSHVARLPVTDPHDFHRAVGDFLSCGIEDEDESADALRLKGASFNQSSFGRSGAYTAPIEGSFPPNLVCGNMQKRSMASNSRQET